MTDSIYTENVPSGTPKGVHTHAELGQGNLQFMHSTMGTVTLHGMKHSVVGRDAGNRHTQVRDKFGVNLKGNQ